jgi:hypothetical protein
VPSASTNSNLSRELRSLSVKQPPPALPRKLSHSATLRNSRRTSPGWQP